MSNDIKLNDNKVSVDRIALIENFTEQLTAMADGESIVGDGGNLV